MIPVHDQPACFHSNQLIMSWRTFCKRQALGLCTGMVMRLVEHMLLVALGFLITIVLVYLEHGTAYTVGPLANRILDLSRNETGLPRVAGEERDLYLPVALKQDIIKLASSYGKQDVLQGILDRCSQPRAIERGSSTHGNKTSSATRTKVLIVVPFRNRTEQLRIFLPEITEFLSRQRIAFRIIVVEQLGTANFNKGSLINIGFIEASFQKGNPAGKSYDCVVIHDVDYIPINDANSYDCLATPHIGAWQMSTAVDKYGWSLPGPLAVGGVNMIRRDVFLLANGLSNRYYGWGGEDNDFSERLQHVQWPQVKRDREIGRYRTLKLGHFRSGVAEHRWVDLKYAKENMREGVSTVKYRALRRVDVASHIRVSVDTWCTEPFHRPLPDFYESGPDEAVHLLQNAVTQIWYHKIGDELFNSTVLFFGNFQPYTEV